ncbi:MAG: hypothetical protein RLY31_756 [Bacteroidota bacterium]
MTTLFGDNGCTLPPVTVVVETVANETVTWTGQEDGILWNDPMNCSSGFTPYSCNEVVIPAGHTVHIDGDVNAVGRTLLVEDGSEVTMDPAATTDIILY